MKKAFALLLCILFILSLGGCKYLEGTPIASHTGQFVLPAGSLMPSAEAAPSALTVPTSAGDSFAFRKTNWGMTRDEVIAREGRQPDEQSGDRIAYVKKTVLDRECDLFYIFSAGKLVSGGYDFLEDDLSNCIADYNNIASALTEQSVSPSASQTIWTNGEFRNDSQKYGLAVLLGDLTYQTVWNAAESSITCELHASASGGARKVFVTVTWQAPAQPQAPAPSQTASPSQLAPASATATEPAAITPSALPSASPEDMIPPLPSPIPSASEASGFSFRNTHWGMAKEAVIASEGREPDKTSDDTVTFAGETFQGRDCSLFYAFDRDTLQTGGYDIRENQEDSIADYNAMAAALTKQYGKPAVSEQLWSNAQRQGDPAAYGRAVAAGDVVFRSVWYTNEATIGCVLYGWGKGKISMTVSFQNPAVATADIETLPGHSFRKTDWGMTMSQVIASEDRQPDEKGGDYLIYKKEKYHNADCHIIYQFTDGNLSSGSYMIYNMHTDPNEYIKDYNTAVSILRQSYGPPAASNQIWNSASRYKNDASGLGTAVLRGDLSLSSQWVLRQAVIDCSITLANTIVAIDITYKNPA